MTKYLIILILVLFSYKVIIAQNIGDYYLPISSDTSQGNRLKFLSDSTVVLSSLPLNSKGRSLRIVYHYVSTDTTIEIIPNTTTPQDTTTMVFNMKLPILKAKLTLTKIKHGFINYTQSIIYVRQKGFRTPKIIYIIDKKTYKQDMFVTDGNGFVINKPKLNKSLQRRLKSIDKNNCTIERYKGITAYEKFGIHKVFGVIVINTSK